MPRYQNRGGNSGIIEYKMKPDSITVTFQDGAIYQYTYSSAGQDDIDQMKQLAQEGRGLNSYINRYVRSDYAQRFR